MRVVIALVFLSWRIYIHDSVQLVSSAPNLHDNVNHKFLLEKKDGSTSLHITSKKTMPDISITVWCVNQIEKATRDLTKRKKVRVARKRKWKDYFYLCNFGLMITIIKTIITYLQIASLKNCILGKLFLAFCARWARDFWLIFISNTVYVFMYSFRVTFLT